MGKKYFLPPGSRDLTGVESEKLWEVESTLTSLFHSLNLKRVYPPIVEYRDVFSRGIGAEKEKKTYKLVDPASGDLLVIRSDVTPQIVRLWWSKNYPEDFGVFYFEKVIRVESIYSGLEKEIFQGGVELLGVNGSEEEILRIVFEVIGILKLMGSIVVIGSVNFLRILDEIYPELQKCFKKRDLTCLRSEGVSKEIVDLIISLPEGSGGLPEIFADEVLRIEKMLSGMPGFNSNKIVIDPFLFPPSSYYNGIIFKVILKNGIEIVVGGRYDNLLEKFGKKTEASGFAIDLIKLISFL